MDRISSNGETYVKANAIARELGYTADYVGQLCRAGKVDAQLVGRSWYVNERSIREHKQNRYRSTATKSKEEIRRAVQTVGSASKPVQQFAYESDDTDLLPRTRERSGVTPMVTASEVPVASEDTRVEEETFIPIRKEVAPEPELEIKNEEYEPEEIIEEQYEVPLRRVEPIIPRVEEDARPPIHQPRPLDPAVARPATLTIPAKRGVLAPVLTAVVLLIALAGAIALAAGTERRVVASSFYMFEGGYSFNTAAVHQAFEPLVGSGN